MRTDYVTRSNFQKELIRQEQKNISDLQSLEQG